MDLLKASRVGSLNEGGLDVVQCVKGGIETNRSSVQPFRRDPPQKVELLVGDAPRGPEADGLAPMLKADLFKPFSQVGKSLPPRNTRQCPIQPDVREFEAFGATEMLEACPAPHAEAAPRDRMAGRRHGADDLSLVNQEVQAATGATVRTDSDYTLHPCAPHVQKLRTSPTETRSPLPGCQGRGTFPGLSYFRPPEISPGLCVLSPCPYDRACRPREQHAAICRFDVSQRAMPCCTAKTQLRRRLCLPAAFPTTTEG